MVLPSMGEETSAILSFTRNQVNVWKGVCGRHGATGAQKRFFWEMVRDLKIWFENEEDLVGGQFSWMHLTLGFGLQP